MCFYGVTLCTSGRRHMRESEREKKTRARAASTWPQLECSGGSKTMGVVCGGAARCGKTGAHCSDRYVRIHC